MHDLFPDQGSTTGPLHWELRFLANRPPGKSPVLSHESYNMLLVIAVMIINDNAVSLLLPPVTRHVIV